MVILNRGAECVCLGIRQAVSGPPLADLEIF